MSTQTQFPELRGIFNKHREVVKMIKAEKKLTDKQINFRVVYIKLGKKIGESKDVAALSAFTNVVIGRYQLNEPDSIIVIWLNADTEEKLYEHTFSIVQRPKEKLDSESNFPVQGLNGFQGLGEAEVNSLVEKRITDLRRAEEQERLKEDNGKMTQKIAELESRNTFLEEDIAAKETTENYMKIIGLALPGISKFFGGASLLNMLAGTEELEQKVLANPKIRKDDREEMIGLLEDYMLSDLNEQEVATLYMLFMEIQKDKTKIQKILSLLTNTPPNATAVQNKN